MRKIKFRIWYLTGNRFYYPDSGDLLISLSGEVLNNFGCMGDNKYEVYPIEGGNDTIIQQFTGLKDKNGKDIYEGDIIKFYTKTDIYNYDYSFRMNYITNPDGKDKWDFVKTIENTKIVEVFFDTQEVDDFGSTVSGWFTKNGSLSNLIDHCQISKQSELYTRVITEANYTIIGNIFENPELLNKE